MTTYGIVGIGRVGSDLIEKLTSKGHVVHAVSDSEPAASTAGHLTSIDELRACDVIVECITESRDEKIAVLTQLAGTKAAVLTTTSSFTVSELATASGLHARLGGFHYLPSYGGRLAEVTAGASDPDVRAAATTLADDLGLATMETPDRPGRISRRLLVPFLENVLRAVDLEIAAPDDIDRVVHLGLGHAVGPLQRLHEAGLADHRAAAATILPSIPTRS